MAPGGVSCGTTQTLSVYKELAVAVTFATTVRVGVTASNDIDTPRARLLSESAHGGDRSTPHAMLQLVAMVLASLLAAGCATEPVVAGAGDLVHIHDLVTDVDGGPLVASHTGLYRIESIDRAVLVGTERHDLMSMTRTADGRLIIGGHPDLRLEEYRVADKPPHLGLTESVDGGETWSVIGLLGEADFHALEPVDRGVLAAESTGRIWLLHDSGQLEQLGAVESRDLSVDPADQQRIVSVDFDGDLWLSVDAGFTWNLIDAPVRYVEVEWGTELFAMEETGETWSVAPDGSSWDVVAHGPGNVETFHIDSDDVWWVTSKGGAIARSDDAGTSWQDVYLPPR